VVGELTRYIFYDCPEAAVICADITKGLEAATAARALRESGVESETTQERSLGPRELPTSARYYLAIRRIRTALRLSSNFVNSMLQKPYKEG
jgi:hypothetical protein